MSDNMDLRACCKPVIKVRKGISVMPKDYEELNNLPQINGISLIGNKTAAELNLLTSNPDSYETISLLEAHEQGISLLAFTPDKVPVKVTLPQERGFSTSDSGPDCEIGGYQFLKIKKGETE